MSNEGVFKLLLYCSMSVLNSALNLIWSSFLYSFSLALSLCFSNVTCSMHLHLICAVFCIITFSFSFFLLHKYQHIALVLSQTDCG